MKRKIFIGLIIVFALIVSGQFGKGGFFDIKAAFGYGGGGGAYSTPIPTITAINTPLTVDSTQEGTFTKNINDDSAKIEVPKGAVDGQTTFNVQSTTANSSEAPANTTGAFMIGNKVFNINATDKNNNAVREFNSNLRITLTLSDLPPDTSNLGVYWFNDTTGVWTLVPGSIFDPANGTVSFNVNHLTKFSILKALGTPLALAAGNAPAAQTVAQKTVLKSYADGSLLRYGKQIFVVMKGKRVKVRTASELAKYKGKTINQVDLGTLHQYAEVTYVAYPNNSIIKSGNKIYIIKNGKKQQIRSVSELNKNIKKYKVKKIYDVSDAIDLY